MGERGSEWKDLITLLLLVTNAGLSLNCDEIICCKNGFFNSSITDGKIARMQTFHTSTLTCDTVTEKSHRCGQTDMQGTWDITTNVSGNHFRLSWSTDGLPISNTTSWQFKILFFVEERDIEPYSPKYCQFLAFEQPVPLLTATSLTVLKQEFDGRLYQDCEYGGHRKINLQIFLYSLTGSTCVNTVHIAIPESWAHQPSVDVHHTDPASMTPVGGTGTSDPGTKVAIVAGTSVVGTLVIAGATLALVYYRRRKKAVVDPMNNITEICDHHSEVGEDSLSVSGTNQTTSHVSGGNNMAEVSTARFPSFAQRAFIDLNRTYSSHLSSESFVI